MNLKTSFLLTFFYLLSHTTFSQNEKFSKEALDYPKKFKVLFDTAFEKEELTQYQFVKNAQKIFLQNGYAEHLIDNQADWLKIKSFQEPTVYQIDLLFTLYPKNTQDWLTDYHQLLTNRLKSLFELDKSLNNKQIKWKMILQTQANSAEAAQELPHGIILHFNSKPSPKTQQSIDFLHQIIANDGGMLKEKPDNQANKTTKKTTLHFKDSTVSKILKRLPLQNALVVIDWTLSMKQHGAQAVLHHIEHFATSGINYFAFFNDGDGKREGEKRIGSTGGIYSASSQNLEILMQSIKQTEAGGNGGDNPENDIEAILTAIERHPNFNQLVLIADNQSIMRDFSLANRIKQPVKIILCNTKIKEGITADYLTLAYRTGGSFEADGISLTDLKAALNSDRMIITDDGSFRLNDRGLFEQFPSKMSIFEQQKEKKKKK